MPKFTIELDIPQRQADALELLRGEEPAADYIARLGFKSLIGRLDEMAADLRRREVEMIIRAAEAEDAPAGLKTTLAGLLDSAREAVAKPDADRR